jgi:predicted dienelactone hydrolase
MRRRPLLVAAAALACWRGALSQSASLPFADETWRDAARQREIPVRLRWPASQPPAGGWPVVLYSHGLGGSRDGGGVWGDAWAAAGFLVVHLQHPGSDTPALRQAARTGNVAQAASAAQLLERIRDVRFALDEITRRQAGRPGRWADVRTKAFGLAGHSFGAHTTLAVAGQRYAGLPPVDEPRLAACIALSPALPMAGDPREALAGVRRPMLCITGSRDGDVMGNGATPERRAQVYDALPEGQKALLLLHEADHPTFAGNSARLAPLADRAEAGVTLQPTHHRLVAAVTADWWRLHLAGETAADARLAQPRGLAARDRWQRG